LGDVPVAGAVGRHLCDAPLAGGERVTTAQRGATRAGTGRDEFFSCFAGEAVGSAAVGEVEPLAEEVSCVAAVTGAAQRGAQLGQRASVLEARRGLLYRVDGLAQEVDSVAAARDEACLKPSDRLLGLSLSTGDVVDRLARNPACVTHL